MKPSVPCWCGKHRTKPSGPAGTGKAAGGSSAKLGSPARKSRDHVLVLLGLERAGGVDEPAARSHQRGRRGQDAALARGGGRHVGRLPPPLHLGVAPQHAEIRARRIDEHAVAQARPPRRQRLHRSVDGFDDRHAEPRGRLRHAAQAAGLGIEREHPTAVVHQLGQMGRLGAGRGAHVGDRWRRLRAPAGAPPASSPRPARRSRLPRTRASARDRRRPRPRRPSGARRIGVESTTFLVAGARPGRRG